MESPYSQPGVVVEDKTNGNGYLAYSPSRPKTVAEFRADLDACVTPRFTEFGEILDLAIDNGSVLLEGEPGAGKSNICQDIERCGRQLGIPLLRITVHINAGTTRTTGNTLALIDRFRNMPAERQGLFILDNVDYVGYRGSSRTRRNAAEYAETIVPELIKTIDDDSTLAVGTAHDEQWRENKWQWNDPAIDQPASELMEAYRAKRRFLGQMSQQSIIELLEQRGVETGLAEVTAQELCLRGLQSFFYAFHIDTDMFSRDPEAAVATVKMGRALRHAASRNR